MSSSSLKAQLRIQQIALKQKDAEIQKLKKALRALIDQNTSEDPFPSEGHFGDVNGSDEEMGWAASDESHEGEDGEGEDVLPEPILGDDNLYFCNECTSEVVDGYCHQCGAEHQYPEDEIPRDSFSTTTQAIHPDRVHFPRGDTPLPSVDMSREIPPTEYCASQYPVRRDSRENEYWELIRRGATRLMCETFHLEFSYQGGIYAWADEEIFREFSGSLMRPGDFWKIQLGRRVELDADDLDGAAFIEGLLEDALLFPYRGASSRRSHEMWLTIEESPGIWVTRIKESRTMDEDDSTSSSSEDMSGDEAESENSKNVESPLQGGETVIRPNQYDVSEDDPEQRDMDIDNMELFISVAHDTAWASDGEDTDELVGDSTDDETGEEEIISDGPSTDDEQALANEAVYFANFPIRMS